MAKVTPSNKRLLFLFLLLLASIITLYLRFSKKKTQWVSVTGTPRSISLFTLNIWFGDYKMQERMSAIGRTIEEQKPDIVTFQEVTNQNLNLLQSQDWFKFYHMVPDKIPENHGYFVIILSKFPIIKWTSLPFKNSRMGRNLLIAELSANIIEETTAYQEKGLEHHEAVKSVYFTIATSHLESMAFATKEREAQLQKSLQILSQYEDVCLMGDLNLELKVDGDVELPTTWFDAWLSIPGNSHSNGYTWNPSINTNAQVSEPNTTKDRFDRVFCKVLNFSVNGMSIVGSEPYNGVFLSDHFGLITNLSFGVGNVGKAALNKKASFMRPKGWENFLN